MTNPCNLITLNQYSHNIESPTIVLKKRNFDVIGEIINYNNWKISILANGIDNISFDVNKYHNGQMCAIWNKLIDLAIIEVQGYGHFEVTINVTDSNETVKSITAQSLEVELGQLTLNEFHVNDDDATTMEQTDFNKDDFDKFGEFIPTVFCNFYDTKHSLLHRVLSDKASHWSIEHVPDYIAINKTDKPELSSQFQRTYTIDGTTIYDFLTGDIAKESNVVFVFDTYSRTINCYNLEDYVWENPEKNEKIIIDAIGDDTTVFLDKDNLAQEITISGDSESIKNCFRVIGGDDVITDRIRAVNMNGTNYIYRFANFQLGDMSSELSQKLIRYQTDMADNEDAYYGENGIYTRLCVAYDTYYLLESKMMPLVEIKETTAKEQYLNMVNELSQLKAGVFLLSSYGDNSFQGITNNVESLGKIFLDPRYTLKILEGNTRYNSQNKKWSGRFEVYRTIDETDLYHTPENASIDVYIDDDEVEYARQKVLKALSKTSMLDIDFDIMDMTDAKIKEYFQLYGRVRLQSFYDGYETCISILAKLTQTTLSPDKSAVADELYCKYNNLKNVVHSVLQERISQVKEQEGIISTIEKEQSEFQAKWNFRNYLGEDLYNIFCMYRRDDDYQNDNYISDGLTDDDAALTKKAKELLDCAKGEIEKSCTLQRTINTTLNNLLGMKEYELIHDKFALFNYIRIGVDDEVFKLRLLGLDFDSNIPETINVTYSENIESINNGSADINSILNQVSSISSSFSATVLQAKSGNEAKNEIVNMRNNGLNAALTRIKSSDDNEVTIGAQGILCKEITDVGYYSDKQSRIIGSGFYITSDNWQTIRACIGETTDGNFGVIADTLCGKVTFSEKIVAGDVNGIVTINGEGVKLKGGSIKWETQINFDAIGGLKDFKDSVEGTLGLGTTITKDSIISPKIGGGYLYIKDARSIGNTGISVEINPNGTVIPNGDGTYVFNIKKNNALIMGVKNDGSGYFSGQINAASGEIGGFSINQNGIYNGCESIIDNKQGLFIGTNGIKFVFNEHTVTHRDYYSSYEYSGLGGSKTLVSSVGIGIYGVSNGVHQSVSFYIDGYGVGSINNSGMYGASGTAIVAWNGNIYGKYINAEGMYCDNEIRANRFSAENGAIISGTIKTDQLRITRDVGIGAGTWESAAILITANTAANGSVRPTLAFECGGYIASTIWYDVDGHFNSMNNGGTNYKFFFNGDPDKLNSPGTYNNHVTEAANVYITGNCNFARGPSSSRRYKHDLKEIGSEMLRGLYDLQLYTFKYNDDYVSQKDERYQKDIPGIMVEDLEEIMPIAVGHENGLPEMWNSNILVPCLLGLIQDLNNRLKYLETK